MRRRSIAFADDCPVSSLNSRLNCDQAAFKREHPPCPTWDKSGGIAVYLETSANDYGDPLSDPLAREHGIRQAAVQKPTLDGRIRTNVLYAPWPNLPFAKISLMPGCR